MNRLLGRGFLCFLVVLALAPAVRADQSPSQYVVIPEAIWAPATGGGTWVTALQITAKVSGTQITVRFFYGTDSRGVTLATTTAAHQTLRYPNILQALGGIDTGFDYSGRVGTLLVFSTDDTKPIWAQAMTTNGNYGKTMPSFVWDSTENTAAIGRQMVIPGIMNSTTYRTFCGFWNDTNYTMTVRFFVMAPTEYASYGWFEKTIPALGFISFNPFVEAGIGSDTFTNSWLLIWPHSAPGAGQGLFCYGSIANNTTNDSYALIAIPFE